MYNLKLSNIMHIRMDRKKFHPSEVVATFFWLGKIPFMPGTIGSVIAFPLWFVVAYFAVLRGYTGYFAGNIEVLSFSLFVILVLFILGVWAADNYEKLSQKDDPGEVIIDEVVAQMLVIALSIYLLPILFDDRIKLFDKLNLKASLIFQFTMFCDFVYFRVFDIAKPWPIKLVDQKVKGGLGIMLDDIAAVPFSLVLSLGTVDMFIELMVWLYTPLS
jgi:phosphatidylglycerophosphatase A